MYVYFEVYDPTIPGEPAAEHAFDQRGRRCGTLYEGDRKVLETQPVRVNRLEAKRENVLSLRLQAQLKDQKPAQYVCQVNVIDELGHKFAFPRMSVVLLAAKEETAVNRN